MTWNLGNRGKNYSILFNDPGLAIYEFYFGFKLHITRIISMGNIVKITNHHLNGLASCRLKVIGLSFQFAL